MNARLVLPLALIFTLCLGCVAAHKIDMHLADVRLGEMRAFETEMLVGVRITNESTEPLRLKGAAYRLYLNDVYVGKGMANESIIVPPFGSAVHTVTLRISNLSLLPTIERLIDEEDFSYRVEASFYGGGLFGETVITDAGRFKLSSERVERPQRYDDERYNSPRSKLPQ